MGKKRSSSAPLSADEAAMLVIGRPDRLPPAPYECLERVTDGYERFSPLLGRLSIADVTGLAITYGTAGQLVTGSVAGQISTAARSTFALFAWTAMRLMERAGFCRPDDLREPYDLDAVLTSATTRLGRYKAWCAVLSARDPLDARAATLQAAFRKIIPVPHKSELDVALGVIARQVGAHHRRSGGVPPFENALDVAAQLSTETPKRAFRIAQGKTSGIVAKWDTRRVRDFFRGKSFGGAAPARSVRPAATRQLHEGVKGRGLLPGLSLDSARANDDGGSPRPIEIAQSGPSTIARVSDDEKRLRVVGAIRELRDLRDSPGWAAGMRRVQGKYGFSDEITREAAAKLFQVTPDAVRHHEALVENELRKRLTGIA